MRDEVEGIFFKLSDSYIQSTGRWLSILCDPTFVLDQPGQSWLSGLSGHVQPLIHQSIEKNRPPELQFLVYVPEERFEDLSGLISACNGILILCLPILS